VRFSAPLDCRSSSIVTRKQNKTSFGLYITIQEEVGLRGAEMITKTIKPNVAIVTDVCHDSHSNDRKEN
jgi:putative aminopeptidase FrvX